MQSIIIIKYSVSVISVAFWEMSGKLGSHSLERLSSSLSCTWGNLTNRARTSYILGPVVAFTERISSGGSFRNAAHSFMGSLLSTRSSFTLGFSSCLLGWKVISPSVSPLIQSYYKSTDLSVCETETCCLNSGQIQEIIFSVVVLLTQSAQQEIVVSGIL